MLKYLKKEDDNMIFEDLQKANIETMKNHDKVAHEIVSLVFGKCKNDAIDKGYPDRKLPDNETLRIIQKTIKELEEEKLAFEKAERAEKVEVLKAQMELLNKYLPKQLSEDEIRNILNDKQLYAVTAYYCDGISQFEISRNLGISQQAASKLIKRTIQVLRDAMAVDAQQMIRKRNKK